MTVDEFEKALVEALPDGVKLITSTTSKTATFIASSIDKDSTEPVTVTLSASIADIAEVGRLLIDDFKKELPGANGPTPPKKGRRGK